MILLLNFKFTVAENFFLKRNRNNHKEKIVLFSTLMEFNEINYYINYINDNY